MKLNKRQLRALSNLIDYNWCDELHDYQVQVDEGNGTVGHIFASLVTLDNLVNGSNNKPKDFLIKRRDND